jgi:hypothetical protein
MNRLRSILFAAIVVIYSSTLALGGIMQTPGKSEPPPPPPASASATESTTDGRTLPTNEIQITWQDLTTETLLEILLIIY